PNEKKPPFRTAFTVTRLHVIFRGVAAPPKSTKRKGLARAGGLRGLRRLGGLGFGGLGLRRHHGLGLGDGRNRRTAGGDGGDGLLNLALVVGSRVLGHATLTTARSLVQHGEQVRHFLRGVFRRRGRANLFQARADGGTDGTVHETGFFSGQKAFFGGLMGRHIALPVKNWGQRISKTTGFNKVPCTKSHQDTNPRKIKEIAPDTPFAAPLSAVRYPLSFPACLPLRPP